jgi:hypothetical protein
MKLLQFYKCQFIQTLLNEDKISNEITDLSPNTKSVQFVLFMCFLPFISSQMIMSVLMQPLIVYKVR